MPRKKNTGTPLQREVQAAIGAEPDLLLLTNPTGLAEYFDARTGKSWKVPYGVGGADGTGGPDLIGILLPWGRIVGFECKSGKGVATDAQKACHALWRRFGAIVGVVRSAQDARDLLAYAREKTP